MARRFRELAFPLIAGVALALELAASATAAPIPPSRHDGLAQASWGAPDGIVSAPPSGNAAAPRSGTTQAVTAVGAHQAVVEQVRLAAELNQLAEPHILAILALALLALSLTRSRSQSRKSKRRPRIRPGG